MASNGSTGQGEASIGRKDLRAAQLAELREIEKQGGGVLHPETVVEYASDPKTALHSAFEWNDTEAARKYRIEQARKLIRVVCEYEPHTGQEVRAFVAIHAERYDDGGYRHMPTLLTTKDGRQSVLETALWELDAFERKYKGLKELADVFAAIRKTRKRAK